MQKVVDFNSVSNLRRVTQIYSQVDDNYIFCHIRPGAQSLSDLIGGEPLKISGTLLILLRKGSPMTIEVNLEEYTVDPGTLVMIFPGNVIRAIGSVPDDIDAYALYFDTKFSRNVNINLMSVSIPSTIMKPRSVVKLSEDEMELLGRYFILLHSTTLDDTSAQISNSIATSLTAAMFYQLVLFYHKRLPGEIAGEGDVRVGSRRNEYVRDFIRLVHVHYVKERSVTFYAEKLFISPKYLSLLVKEATGRSAAQWIDAFVLMEAKNMLRFSGKNIQQVAYALNFPTQSSFGKYFKHLTGMSPSEYQKS